ncbi:hypothetical protein MML48_7g00007272 [Holotrichia oblita]|uniref:Uncharacterized protein n=1 Tax=Holotrichia oblita TaxID=644536 RepID=A0ACB9SU99_HOLOL|nr:hypothetical protein MML48_7g00007272 [Holotrichia oblita]
MARKLFTEAEIAKTHETDDYGELPDLSDENMYEPEVEELFVPSDDSYAPTTDSSNFSDSSDEPDPSTARKARKRKSTFQTEDIAIPSTSSEDTPMVVQEAVDNNTTSGAARQSIPYEAELSKIALLDDSIEPEVKRSTNTVKITTKAKNTVQKENYVEGKSSSKKSIRKVLMEIHQQKEASKERRHKEKFEMIRTLLESHKE